ncbi:MAG: hypothetical protein IJP84_01700 [Lachnospiraceae bacterium]|nr:hypothetical protein [Lachnospiraceae bacterium]
MENNELVYKRMVFSGALNVTLGIVLLVVGIVSGIMLLISGGKLLRGKSRLMI